MASIIKVDQIETDVNLTGSASAPSLYPKNDTNTGIFFPAADTFSTATGGTERLRIDSSGNVGIGTSSPTTKLAVLSSSAAVLESIKSTNTTAQTALLQVLNDTDTPINLGVFGSAAGTHGILGASTPFVSTNASTLNFVNTNASGVFIWGIGATPTEQMRLTSTGLGIGTASPDALLTVNTIASFGAGAAATPSIAAKGDLNTGVYFPAADTLAASTGGSERMRINSSGNVGIGTTGPGAKLQVISNSGSGQDFRVDFKDAGASDLSSGAAQGVNFYTDGDGGNTYSALSLSGSNSQNAFALNAWKVTSGAGSASNLILQNGGGNVGIGTTSPKGIGHIYRGASGISTFDTDGDELIIESNARAGITLATPDAQSSYIVFANPSDTFAAAIVWNYTNKRLSIIPETTGGELLLGYGYGSTGMYINSSGNVGIGTASPGATLQVAAGTNTYSAPVLFNVTDLGLDITDATKHLALWAQHGGSSHNGSAVGTRSNHDLALITNDTKRMVINTSGNVGIGTTSPDQTLVVKTANGGGIGIENASAKQWRWAVGTVGEFTCVESGIAERMRIDTSGNLLVGATSPYVGTSSNFTASTGIDIGSSSTATAKPLMFIRSTTTGLVGYIVAATTSFSDYCRIDLFVDNTGGGTQAGSLRFNTTQNATSYERMRIDASGNLLVGTTSSFDGGLYKLELFGGGNRCLLTKTNGTSTTFAVVFQNGNGSVGSVSTSGSSTAYNTSSDYRLKHDIAPMTGALEKVQQLKPVTYKWNADDSDGQGFIAHELQAVIPDAVTGEKDAMHTEQYEISPAVAATFDEDGVELTPAVEAVMGEREVPSYQGVDTSFLVATLTAAIQEQQAIIESLKARLDAANL